MWKMSEIKGETTSVTAFLSVSQFNGNVKKLEVFQDLCTLREYQQKNRTWPWILVSVRFNIIATSLLAPTVMWLPNPPHPSCFLTYCRFVFLFARFFGCSSSSHSPLSCCSTLFSSFSAGLFRVFVFVPAFAFRFLTCFFGPSPDYSSPLDWFARLPDWFPGFNPLLSKNGLYLITFAIFSLLQRIVLFKSSREEKRRGGIAERNIFSQ